MSCAAPLLFSLIWICFTVLVLAEQVARLSNEKIESSGLGTAVRADLWCVAKNNAEDGALQAALDWACGLGGADCRPIQQGGACFNPDDIQFHASYAFNDYFIRNGVSQQACDFGGTAALTSLNPGLHFGQIPYPVCIISFISFHFFLSWAGNANCRFSSG